eukprot:9488992-Pyramimonas_sp.AAC.1
MPGEGRRKQGGGEGVGRVGFTVGLDWTGHARGHKGGRRGAAGGAQRGSKSSSRSDVYGAFPYTSRSDVHSP